MHREGYLEVNPRILARILADEIGGDLAEHQKALEWLQRPDPKNECQVDKGQRLFRVPRGYFFGNALKYRLLCQSIEQAEYKKNWDRQNRPSGWQRAKAKRISPNQSDT
jgi:hypothetical protein